MRDIEIERQQLVQHWSKVIKRSPCWLASPFPQLTKLLTPDIADRGMAVRKFHDKLGFCAKGRVETGGLCVGAIFRTSSFMGLQQPQRSGSRVAQTVHIEHTVPAGVLARELQNRITLCAFSPVQAIAWLLRHSVTTAMRKGQDKAHLKGVTRTTTAFDTGSPDSGRPFARYDDLFRSGESVWDVWNRAEVDPHELTFDRHFATVMSLMHHAGADKVFLRKLENAA